LEEGLGRAARGPTRRGLIPAGACADRYQGLFCAPPPANPARIPVNASVDRYQANFITTSSRISGWMPYGSQNTIRFAARLVVASIETESPRIEVGVMDAFTVVIDELDRLSMLDGQSSWIEPLVPPV
jgi:hypothetical protein